MAKRKHSKATQKQKQRQTQIVNVNIHGQGKRKSSRRKRKQPTMEEIAKADYLQPQQMPLVAYQTGYGTFPLVQGTQQPNQPFYMLPPQPRSINMLQDVGQVGTEGRVQILQLPTKSEQLAELTAPVNLPIPEQNIPQFNPMANVGAFEFGGGTQVPPSPFLVAENAPMNDQASIAEPYFRVGSKGYYIQKIKEMTGKELKPNESSLKELKYTYKMLKGGKQK